MAHFAQIDKSNKVLRVIVVNNDVLNNLKFPESEALGVEFCKSLFGENTKWKQTSYNGSFRKRFAGQDYCYNDDLDVYIAPQPYPSWTLDQETTEWLPPVPMPVDGKLYRWDEQSFSWTLIEQATP